MDDLSIYLAILYNLYFSKSYLGSLSEDGNKVKGNTKVLEFQLTK